MQGVKASPSHPVEGLQMNKNIARVAFWWRLGLTAPAMFVLIAACHQLGN